MDFSYSKAKGFHVRRQTNQFTFYFYIPNFWILFFSSLIQCIFEPEIPLVHEWEKRTATQWKNTTDTVCFIAIEHNNIIYVLQTIAFYSAASFTYEEQGLNRLRYEPVDTVGHPEGRGRMVKLNEASPSCK